MADKKPAKKPAKKKPAGKKRGAKPFQFTPEILESIQDMAANGLTQVQISRNIGLDPATLSRKKSNNDQLSQAIENGKASGLQKMASALFENGVGGNFNAQQFYLCNRDPDNWKHVSKAGEDKDKDDDKLTQVLAALIAKLPD